MGTAVKEPNKTVIEAKKSVIRDKVCTRKNHRVNNVD